MNKSVVCKRCGEGGLFWSQTNAGKWYLGNPQYHAFEDGKTVITHFSGHNCKPTPEQEAKFQAEQQAKREQAEQEQAELDAKMKAQQEAVASWGIEDLVEIENKLVPIIAEAEYRGICFDEKLWGEVVVDELKAASKAEEGFMQSLGIEPTIGLLGGTNYPVNLNSPVQVLEVLKENGYVLLENTSKETLEEYIKSHSRKEPLEYLLTYREHQKRASFNYPQYINSETNKIHTTYNQCGTATGRMSSSGPNLQNVVADKRYRRLFRAEDGDKLIVADWCWLSFLMMTV